MDKEIKVQCVNCGRVFDALENTEVSCPVCDTEFVTRLEE